MKVLKKEIAIVGASSAGMNAYRAAIRSNHGLSKTVLWVMRVLLRLANYKSVRTCLSKRNASSLPRAARQTFQRNGNKRSGTAIRELNHNLDNSRGR